MYIRTNITHRPLDYVRTLIRIQGREIITDGAVGLSLLILGHLRPSY
ncbi:hypothetical protein ES288_D12G158000v1 [Gossypium darwinii]|uniref:Uncharacterized protein n=1 Tax=Gossypium darwinii TaxID=34276 RepID=A0A5D2A9W2_GOSDA|nr:hypothetical protein ES288_D12G158000v1 [Gossypium darwinii]